MFLWKWQPFLNLTKLVLNGLQQKNEQNTSLYQNNSIKSVQQNAFCDKNENNDIIHPEQANQLIKTNKKYQPQLRR